MEEPLTESLSCYLCLGFALFELCYHGDLTLTSVMTPTGRALVDSLTHGLVGGLSWVMVRSPPCNIRILQESAVCMLLAMAVDVDHFVAAKSFKLEAALTLSSRPVFHATTLVPVIFGGLFILSVIVKSPRLQKFSWMFLLAWLSHHIRDGERRGLWLPPLFETKPLPRWLYYTVTLTLPLAVKIVMPYCVYMSRPTVLTESVIDV